MGPIMLDVLGTSLTEEDKELLQHPKVGGLILFTRNYETPEQLFDLTKEIRKAANKEFLIAVDHEGGRVQRFRPGFSKIPAMGKIWDMAKHDLIQAQYLATHCGTLMALEVQAVGIDISFAPILDVNGISDVIGDRAFHHDPKMVTPLASAFIDGMSLAGMQATGKHFPGHGSIKDDSHIALPVDQRSRAEVEGFDLTPFKALIKHNNLSALMPAHIIFPEVDDQAVGFSRLWLQQILRKELSFDGVIFSDDLSMEGASCVGGYIERAEAAQQAGCDMLLTCNNRAGAIDVIDHANLIIDPISNKRIERLLKKSASGWADLSTNKLWQQAQQVINDFD